MAQPFPIFFFAFITENFLLNIILEQIRALFAFTSILRPINFFYVSSHILRITYGALLMGNLVEGEGLIFPKSRSVETLIESGDPLKLQTATSASFVVPSI
jgi:hypothetical protein